MRARYSRIQTSDVSFTRPPLERKDDPAFWDGHHKRVDARVAEGDSHRVENWPQSRQLALLMIRRGHLALDCIAHIQGVHAGQDDFLYLRQHGIAIKALSDRYHRLTPYGLRIAKDCCFAVAKRLGLHHITYVMDSWSEHKVRCTCGWFAALNRRNNNGALTYLRERAARHCNEVGGNNV